MEELESLRHEITDWKIDRDNWDAEESLTVERLEGYSQNWTGIR